MISVITPFLEQYKKKKIKHNAKESFSMSRRKLNTTLKNLSESCSISAKFKIKKCQETAESIHDHAVRK